MDNRLFCAFNPATDFKIELGAASAIKHLPGVVGPPIVGPAGTLENINPKATLYLMAHGHSERPLFKIGNQTWTAQQMANLLEKSKLRKDHREIVMLVCHAGQSLGERSVIQQRMNIHAQTTNVQKKIERFENKRQFGKQMEQEQQFGVLKKQYDGLSGHKPAKFEKNTQILPMVAQFIQCLKNQRYNYIRVTSFMGEVSTDFSRGIKVKVGGNDVPANAANTKIWL